MNIHIEKITVRRDGPLAEDFDLDCGELNLIYGQNESGKSYIVESLIESLFQTSGHGVRNNRTFELEIRHGHTNREFHRLLRCTTS